MTISDLANKFAELTANGSAEGFYSIVGEKEKEQFLTEYTTLVEELYKLQGGLNAAVSILSYFVPTVDGEIHQAIAARVKHMGITPVRALLDVVSKEQLSFESKEQAVGTVMEILNNNQNANDFSMQFTGMEEVTVVDNFSKVNVVKVHSLTGVPERIQVGLEADANHTKFDLDKITTVKLERVSMDVYSVGQEPIILGIIHLCAHLTNHGKDVYVPLKTDAPQLDNLMSNGFYTELKGDGYVLLKMDANAPATKLLNSNIF